MTSVLRQSPEDPLQKAQRSIRTPARSTPPHCTPSKISQDDTRSSKGAQRHITPSKMRSESTTQVADTRYQSDQICVSQKQALCPVLANALRKPYGESVQIISGHSTQELRKICTQD
ncbi:hypothetical protein Nepgr_027287 [Nepenthes gracilis]|uniref:Uncharacterized protein n=1 Tax=Nepenthes gracilis TaxID=150966 RepID=A0AAD3TAJ3_NEPGR|nr:hypothetical protein Nepgr_027287 [Nepenthes gracilis]